MQLFRASHGLIPACDTIDDLSDLVRDTTTLPFIVGYKIGMVLALSKGLGQVVHMIREYSGLPIIYDHQKFGTDVPDVCGGEVIQVFQGAGLQAVIIFPQAGPNTLEAAVKSLQQASIVPVVGGDMTHRGYLQAEGGYILDSAPSQMYSAAAALGVDYYVVPGTRPASMLTYKTQLASQVREPKFLFPGIGRGQGGDIAEAFRQVHPFPSYAIVGRGIYAATDRVSAAKRLWEAVEESGLA